MNRAAQGGGKDLVINIQTIDGWYLIWFGTKSVNKILTTATISNMHQTQIIGLIPEEVFEWRQSCLAEQFRKGA